MPVKFRLYCLLLAAALSIHAPLDGQVLYGSLVGTVSDASNAVVPNTTVGITNRDTGFTREVKTDEQGRYAIPNVPAGTYEIKVAAAGFKPQTQTGAGVTINNILRVDFTLEVGQVSEQVTVEANAVTLQTDKADVHVELSGREITQLPLAKYRNYQTLINLVPGATPGRFQNANTDTPARALTTNINGTNRNNNNTKLDGAANILVWLPHHTVYVAPAETIETVNISTNNFDAEQGLAGGAAITVTTKSGTNDLHGSAFYFHENSAWGSKNVFFRGGPKTPKGLVTIPGFTLGGPIKKNKLFFFGGWEGLRERVNRNRLFTLPTADMRAGNFSAYAPAFTIYDFTTGDLAGRNRIPFPNNILPGSRMHAISRQVQELIPATNLPGNSANFFNAASQLMNRDNFDVKINFQRNERHMLWGKYSIMKATVTGEPGLGRAIGNCLCDGGIGTGDSRVQVVTLGQNWTISPNFLTDTTIGFTRMGHKTQGPDFGQNIGLDVLKIPGTNGPDPRQGGFPILNISGFDSLGNINGWSPVYRNDQSFSLSQNFSKLSGAHEFRFGYDGYRHLLNHWQPELGPGPRGTLSFTQEVTGLNGVRVGFPNGWATFLLGQPNNVGKSIQLIKMNVQEYQHGIYFRDRWQARRNLTINLGLRWEKFPLFTRAGTGGIEGYDPNTNQVLLGNLGGNPTHLGIGTSNKMLAPRVGIAWRLGSDTVIRTGYGITYNPMPLARPIRGFYPLTISQQFNPINADPTFVAAFHPFQSIDRGIPEIPLPNLSTGRVTLPITADMRYINTSQLTRGYIQSWNFFIQRKLPGDLLADIGYVGTRTVHSFGDINANAAAAGTGQRGQPLFTRFGRANSILSWNGQLDANYHGLQVAVNRRAADGLFLKGAYTFSKAMNQTDDDGWAGVTWNHSDTFHRNRARAGYDIPHMFQMGFAYELPAGKGKKIAQSGVASKILGNWQTNGGLSFVNGRPFGVGAPAGNLNSPGGGQTANQVKTAVERFGDPDNFYDRTAFAAPTQAGTYGSTGRNILRGPGIRRLDLSLYKKMPLSEKYNLEFRAEAFNLTNTPEFGNPDGGVTSANFMRITSSFAVERTIRFGLRFGF